MKSREDETWTEYEEKSCCGDYLLAQIALSLGRIADMLAEQQGYIVQYDEEKGKKNEIN